MVKALSEEELWQLFFEDPTSWWDNRAVKSSPRFPDFKHATTGASLWINSRTPRWVAPKLSTLGQQSVESCHGAHVRIGSTARKRNEAETRSLAAYLELVDKGVVPGTGSVLAALKFCSSSRDLQAGRKIHRDVVDSGEVSNIFVANTLIDMYSKCGSVAEARQVFDSMKHRDVVSWTAIIQGYANAGEGELALKLCERMQDEGLRCNRVSILAALKACSRLAERECGELVEGRCVKVRSLEKARAVAAFSEADPDLFVANSLIDVYSKCGSMVDAQQVFDKIKHHSVVSWNCIIRGYAENGDGGKALDCYELMQRRGFVPDTVTFVAALKACACLAEENSDRAEVKQHCLDRVRSIRDQAAKDHSRVLAAELMLANTLVDAYAKCGSLEDARHVFERTEQRTVVSWTVIILGYAQNGEYETALDLYARMRDDQDCAANVVTILAALKACVGLSEKENSSTEAGGRSCLDRGQMIHAEAARISVEANQNVANTLVDMYAKCGSLDDALRVFEAMDSHNVVSWNCLILGYVNHGDGETALATYSSMQDENCVADRITFIAALKACASCAEEEEAKLVEGNLMKRKSFERGRALHDLASRSLDLLDLPMLNTLVDMYAKSGSMEDARRLFESMPQRTVVSWNCIILGYAQSGEPDLALRLYARMRDEDSSCLPDAVTLTGVFKACGALGALESGKKIQEQDLRSLGLDRDTMVLNSLLDFYCKCGSMTEAEQVFGSISAKTQVTFAVLMSGYSSIGQTQRVFELFEDMQQQRIRPDGVTFLALLTACSHAGLVDRGKDYFQAMISRKFGLVPNRQHYSCMVDMLGRANQLDEAVSLIRRLPSKPDAVVWIVLLAAAEKWNSVEAGKLAFESLMKLDARNASAFVLMFNVYAGAGMVKELIGIQDMYKQNHARMD